MSGIHARKFKKFGAQHYGFNHEEMVGKRGKGILIEMTNGRIVTDLASGYASNGYGHCYRPLHEAMINALAIDADGWGILGTIPNAVPTVEQVLFLERICELFGYDAPTLLHEDEKALPMNSGAEAVETAIKLARVWGYDKKGVPEGKAMIVVCDGNFHGRTTTIIGFSSEPSYRDPFAPATPGFISIPFGDVSALERALRENPNAVAFLFEPIQGEGGVNIPPDGYLKQVRELCTKHNVLMIADEIQTGLGRTGKLLACEHDGVRPDIVALGKLLGAGKVPVSVVLADKKHMVFKPGQHGSTYAGNAFCMTVAKASLDILVKEQFCDKSAAMGAYLLTRLRQVLLPRFGNLIAEIRGRGLMLAIVPESGIATTQVVTAYLAEGLFVKDAHGVIRITPPLIITKEECDDVVVKMSLAWGTIAAKKKACACGHTCPCKKK